MSADGRCELCGGTDWASLHDIDGYRVVRCRDCGLVFVADPPSAAELVALYDAAYFEDASEAGYEGYAETEQRKRHHFRSLLDELDRIAARGSLFEIGCAYGFFLDEARWRGWEVRGVEPSAAAMAHARDELALDVVPGPFSALPVDAPSVDAIVMWDVIEHLPNPRETLAAAREWLRPGGIVAISTGDVDSLAARLHGRDWSLMTPPWHQFYFSRRTLRRMLGDVGFELVRMGGDGAVAVDPQSPSPRVPRPLRPLLTNRYVSTIARRRGAGSIMFAWARKPAG